MVRAQTSANTLTDTGGAGNQTDINACDISSSGIFFIGTENARLLTSDCVAPTSINLIDLEPCWYPPDLQHPHWDGEVDQSVAGGHSSNNGAHGDHCLWHEINIQIWLWECIAPFTQTSLFLFSTSLHPFLLFSHFGRLNGVYAKRTSGCYDIGISRKHIISQPLNIIKQALQVSNQ